MDEEKKVEAVREFYEDMPVNNTTVKKAPVSWWVTILFQPNLDSARTGVPLLMLGFSGLYWGYGFAMYMN